MGKRKRVSDTNMKAVTTLLLFTLMAVTAQDPQADTNALTTFRDTFDPSGRLLKWSNSTATCKWQGILCYNNRVVGMRLPGVGLRGIIPPSSLGLLTELRIVSLRNNHLTGPFPGELGKCTHVHSLYLGHNDFYGPLPDLTGFWPRLTHLSLEYNRFNGTIQDSLNLFSHLYLLNLANNTFSGSIPALHLVNLTQLNFSNNNLSGEVPASLSTFPATTFLGNPGLCGAPTNNICLVTASPAPSPSGSPTPAPAPTPPTPQASSKSKLLGSGAITAITVGAVALFVLFCIGLLLCCWKRIKGWKGTRRPAGDKSHEKGAEERRDEYSSSITGEVERNKLIFFEGKRFSFDLEDLLRASAEVLGKGSVGTAYKAVLEDGTILAVKRLKDVTTGRKDFETQIEMVGKLHHRNLVPLRAYYYSKDEKLLVYDYLPMGSLSTLLHGNRGSSRTPLDWITRVRIALGAARGIAFLHEQGGAHKFAHGNIKSSNILLNRELQACVSDFGLAQLLSSTAAASRIVGYRAPEITETRKVTQKSDVYSFGVVNNGLSFDMRMKFVVPQLIVQKLLLELLTGKAPTQASVNDEGIDLPRWVQSVVREEWTAEVFDLELMRYQNIEEEMVAMLQIAMQCVEAIPDRRPAMSDVVPLLEDVHQFSDTGDESRQSESLSEEKSKSSDKDKDSQENTPSHVQTPSGPSSDSLVQSETVIA